MPLRAAIFHKKQTNIVLIVYIGVISGNHLRMNREALCIQRSQNQVVLPLRATKETRFMQAFLLSAVCGRISAASPAINSLQWLISPSGLSMLADTVATLSELWLLLKHRYRVIR